MRINKAIALAGIASRRGAEELILAKKVKLNGVCVTDLGTRVTPHDTLTVDGIPLHIPFTDNKHTYILLNKPVAYISSCSDPQGRPTVLTLLPKKLQKERLYPVGRLDYFSEGLLILTNDGDLTYALTHPKHHIPKEYAVTVRAELSKNDAKIFEKGMILSTGEKLAPMQFRLGTQKKGLSTFYLTLHQGINRQIRKICKDLNWTITRLERIRIGNLLLSNLNIKKGGFTLVEKDFLLKSIQSTTNKNIVQ